ncbi:MAG: four helix bundle protein [Acidobacteriia bacterium]|nr:four helix bundle protein [Terriglobia bacterium]
MTKTELENRTKEFALCTIEFVRGLPKNAVSQVVGRQLLKAATSVGANYREANRAESRNDFLHKISIVEKEAAETDYWLELLLESSASSEIQIRPLMQESTELLKIFTFIRRTLKTKTQGLLLV